MEMMLRPELLATLADDAQAKSQTLDAILNEAVEYYLRERAREKIEAEITVFETLHSQLKAQYLGQWIAMHAGQVIDHDPDHAALYLRTRAKYGRTPVLIREVMEQPDEELWVRTPSTGKMGA